VHCSSAKPTAPTIPTGPADPATLTTSPVPAATGARLPYGAGQQRDQQRHRTAKRPVPNQLVCCLLPTLPNAPRLRGVLLEFISHDVQPVLVDRHHRRKRRLVAVGGSDARPAVSGRCST